MSTEIKDGATEKLLRENSEDLERLMALSDRDTNEHTQRPGPKQWHLLLQISGTLGAIFLIILVAYLCGLRLVLAEAIIANRKHPSMMPDCKSTSLLLD